MALKATISKDEFENLDETLQPHYSESGDNYLLDAEGVEDVTGLKAKRDELLAELKKQKSLTAQFEGLDPAEAKKALKDLQKIEKEKLEKQGKYEELLETYKTEYEQKLQSATAERDDILNNLKRQNAINFLVKKGVIPDRAKYAMVEVGDKLELESGDEGFKLKLKGGVGDSKELDGLVDSLKESNPFFFDSTTVPGGGASGSNTNGNGATGKILTDAQFEALTPREKITFSNDGGKIT